MASKPPSRRCTLTHGHIQTSHHKGKGCNQKKQKGPQRLTSTKPQKKNKQEYGRGLDLSKQAWVLTQKSWKIANRAQTCKKELIQTLY